MSETKSPGSWALALRGELGELDARSRHSSRRISATSRNVEGAVVTDVEDLADRARLRGRAQRTPRRSPRRRGSRGGSSPNRRSGWACPPARAARTSSRRRIASVASGRAARRCWSAEAAPCGCRGCGCRCGRSSRRRAARSRRCRGDPTALLGDRQLHRRTVLSAGARAHDERLRVPLAAGLEQDRGRALDVDVDVGIRIRTAT